MVYFSSEYEKYFVENLTESVIFWLKNEMVKKNISPKLVFLLDLIERQKIAPRFMPLTYCSHNILG